MALSGVAENLCLGRAYQRRLQGCWDYSASSATVLALRPYRPIQYFKGHWPQGSADRLQLNTEIGSDVYCGLAGG